MKSVVIKNIGDLVTMEPLVLDNRFTNISETDLGRISDAWIHLESGSIKAYGCGPHPQADTTINAQGKLVTPGFIDCHTHPVFGGNRAEEFTQRLAGATYQEIAAAGGGIQYTRKHTINGEASALLSSTLENLEKFLDQGTTTIEAKSGYGLTVESELKLLRILKDAETQSPVDIKSTCLGLHAIPPEYSTRKAFVEDMTNNLLPQVAKEKLAVWVDAFIEKGYFEKEDARPYLDKAKELGFGIRLHVDEFVDVDGGKLAAEYQAISADHLEHTNLDGIKAMASKGVVAVILPGTSLYTKIPFTNGKRFVEHGCPVALASDFNPGSCRFYNLSFVATLGALYNGLSMQEAFAGITWVPAKAMDLHKNKGALVPDFDADLQLFPYNKLEDWIADAGQLKPTIVIKNGQLVRGN